MPNANEEDGKLCFNGMLWDVGVVVKDAVIPDEFLEAVEDSRSNAEFLSKPAWMVFSIVVEVDTKLAHLLDRRGCV